jgi:hypothetical protein
VADEDSTTVSLKPYAVFPQEDVLGVINPVGRKIRELQESCSAKNNRLTARL